MSGLGTPAPNGFLPIVGQLAAAADLLVGRVPAGKGVHAREEMAGGFPCWRCGLGWNRAGWERWSRVTELAGGVLRRRGRDVAAGAQFEAGQTVDPRHDLEMPVPTGRHGGVQVGGDSMPIRRLM